MVRPAEAEVKRMDRLKKIGVFLALLAILGGGAVLLFWDLGAECRSILTSGVGEGNYLLTASDAENIFIVLATNLLPPVLASLRECGIVPGREIQIVSHCNTPATKPLASGINYVAFNAKSILLHSIDRLRQPRPEAEGVEFIPPEYVTFGTPAWN